MRPWPLLVLLCFVLGFSPWALAESPYIICEYPLPTGSTDIGAMTVDANGIVWLIQNEPPVLYKLVRDNLTFSQYALEGFENAGFAGMSVDGQGNVWFADLRGNRFGAYTEATNDTAHFNFPGPMAPTSVVRRGDIVWIGCKEEVGEYDLRFPDEPFIDHFVYNYNSFIYDIQFDRKGDIWFVENAVNKVGVYWHNYDKISEFVIPTEGAYPFCHAIDNRSRLWFVESAPNKLGMFDMERFSFTEYDLPAIDGVKPVLSRVATVDDAVWLTDVKNGRAVRFLPDSGEWAAAVLGEGTAPVFIEADDSGMLWIYESGAGKLVALEVTERFGLVTPTPEPTATPRPCPSPSPQPTRTPGVAALIAITALALSALVCRRRR
ncbi:MAG: Virginiamycin B lyase [Methanocella sp. PtaU1.Bin125]|nr:MAG: Virginiamycin B lyase [Methanocella sp. PtaU1.Bin125]